MAFRKGITLFGILLLALNVFAQNGKDYPKQWQDVEQFEKKGLVASALKAVNTIYTLALRENNQPQQVKAVMYQMKYRNEIEQDNIEKNIYFVDSLISKTQVPARNILRSMQAELLWTYLQFNRHRFYDRTMLFQDNSTDLDTWSLEKLTAKITSLYKLSLQNEKTLKSTPTANFNAVILKGKNSQGLRPTLYDFLAHRALKWFTNQERTITQPAYQFIINDPAMMAPAASFIRLAPATKDTSSLYYNALLVYQDLIRFHFTDKDPAALISADLARLAFVNEHGVFENKDSIYERALMDIESRYKVPASAEASYLRALIYLNQGEKYNPFTNPGPQMMLKKALETALEIVKDYPSTIVATRASQLIRDIKRTNINIETEKVLSPALPSKALVKFKNAGKLYLRLISTTRTEIKNLQFESGERKTWDNLIRRKALKEWSVDLPTRQDYQEHSAEIPISPLQPGTFFLISSTDPGFSLNNSFLTRQVVYVSSISYISNNSLDLYTLNRETGLPLKNAEVHVWENKYDYGKRANTEVKTGSYTTNANGYVKLKEPTERGANQSLQVKYNGEELFTNDVHYNYNYNYDRYKTPSNTQTFLFSDRSIYRPGQTIYYKGIVVRTDSATKKSEVVAGVNSTILLFDANHQRITSSKVSSNKFGSFNGNFKLPEGLLNGQYFLRDSVTNSIYYFSVEEYKRPEFQVEINKPSGTYKLNDSITVTGKAKAYAGNNIDGASVNYRVVRKVRYPIWWWGGFSKIWPPMGRAEAMEITNGTTLTDQDGNFSIVFRAIPDLSVDKKDQPVFYYEVTTDITDISGETRSGNTSVAVAYQALKLEILAPAKIDADSLVKIQVKSTNINDIFEKTKVTLAVFRLQSPDKIFRSRYWQVPDLQVLSKEEFQKLFPHDAYSDEDQVNKWPVGEKVIDVTDTTSSSFNFNTDKSKLAPGWYKFLVTTTDKYGEIVKAEHYINVTGEKINDAVEIIPATQVLQPNEKARYRIATGYDNIWLIHSVHRMNDKTETTYPTVSSITPFRNLLDVKEDDRGGIQVEYAFVKHNRVYFGNSLVQVPWTNKDLNISYETFRDKTLPGSDEKWKVKIRGEKGERVSAELLVGMYDASLDQFKPHQWNSFKGLWPVMAKIFRWADVAFGTAPSITHFNEPPYPQIKSITFDELLNNGWNQGGYSHYYMRDASGAAPVAQALEEVVVTKRTMKTESRVESAAVGNVASDQLSDTIISPPSAPPINNNIHIRTNLAETAFFFPVLTTDADGNVEFSFTIPEALTQWKVMSLAHTTDLKSNYLEKTVITQKPLMVQPNVPRFLREGDAMELPVKISNLEKKELTGVVQLELIDASTGNPVDGWMKNVFPSQYFTVPAEQSVVVKFPVTVPFSFNSALTYRVKAVTNNASGSFSDGEESTIPVLTNRTLVTESFPLTLKTSGKKLFRFDKLLNSSSSGTLSHHNITVEYTSNPVWYAVQALPYLEESKYECAEQFFNRYYANTLAGFISASVPKLKAVFEKWRITDTAALLSNLEKNQELKSVLLEETPWVLNAQNETQQKKNIAILFDIVRMAREKSAALNKLMETQTPNGGFPWFKGGPDDIYITQYILSGIGHLKKLGALNDEDRSALQPIISRALPYLDARIRDNYQQLLKSKGKLTNNNLTSYAVQYLYMRSFFPEQKIANDARTAYNYYSDQSAKFWLSQGKYFQGMIALSLHRKENAGKVPAAILASLQEHAINDEELGMYWKEFTTGGYYWHQAPIESHSLLLEAFSEIRRDNKIEDELKTWLLRNKQTRNWHTSKATAEACYAILLSGSDWLGEEKTVSIKMGNSTFTSSGTDEAGTGYLKKIIPARSVQPGMGNIEVTVQSTSNAPSTSWGAVYWQYFEDLDKITSAETPLKLVKKLFIEKNSAKGPVLHAVADEGELKVGDKVKVRIELRVDRDMEYVHMKDMRSASMEPVNVLSGYKYQGGLGYYESTKDASTNFFFSWLPRGTYVFEYPMFVNQAGNFSNGITTIQSMYAPEFSSHSEGIRINVSDSK